ncbi:Uncharacterised protein [Serratia rubidaea]|nr:Uncharacterised protein [Serratia rubidaea]
MKMRLKALALPALAAAVLFSSSAISAPTAKEAPAPQMAGKERPPFPGPHPMPKPGFCHGGELFCASSLSDNPTETINKLTSVIPAGKAKRYEVRVSVVELPAQLPVPPAS